MEKQVTDSDSSDDYGPMPSTEKASIEVEQQKRIREIEERTHLKVPRANIPKTSVREEWMMKPPDALRGLGDQKSRQFSMKGKGDLDHSVWTSAPSERERAENDVKKRKIDEETDSAPTASDLAIRAAIKRHNAQVRGQSLLEQHSIKNAGLEDDCTKRSFNRANDIGNQRLDSKARQEVIDESKNLDSKFVRGKKNYL